MKLIVFLLFLVLMIGAPALVGVLIGGDEITAWSTAITAFVIVIFVELVFMSQTRKES